MWSKLLRRDRVTDTNHWAESYVADYLQDQGLQLKEKNYRCKLGEIDLIMADRDNTLVFVEVRYRKQQRYGTPLETVDRIKQRKLVHTATHYLQQRRLVDRCPCRFDVVAVSDTVPNSRDRANIEWTKNAFEPC